MAGQPKMRAFENKIEEMGGDSVILDLVAEGTLTMREIAKKLGTTAPQLYNWRNRGGEQRKAAWKEARKIAAHMIAEEGLEKLDNGKPNTAAEASMLKSQAEYRKWLASVWNREEMGNDRPASAAETLEDFASAFVSIIERANKGALPPAATMVDEEEPEEADYELVDDDAPRLESAD